MGFVVGFGVPVSLPPSKKKKKKMGQKLLKTTFRVYHHLFGNLKKKSPKTNTCGFAEQIKLLHKIPRLNS